METTVNASKLKAHASSCVLGFCFIFKRIKNNLKNRIYNQVKQMFFPFFILFVALIYGQVWGFWSFGFIYCDHHVLSSMYLFSEHAAWAFWPVFSCFFLNFSSFISLTIIGLHAFSFLLFTVASFFLFFFGYISCW